MLPGTQENIRKVLAIQVGNQQDLVKTIPALRNLRNLLPEAAITLMVSPTNQELGLQMHWADDVILYEGADTSFANVNCELGLISQLRQYAFDTSIIFTNARESPFSLAYICY